MTRPATIVAPPTCQHCGNPLTRGGAAIACSADGTATRIPLPGWCADPQCRRDRDAAAMARAIASGLIRDASADPVEPCPECTAGKHGNCDGTSWDESDDAPTHCPCSQAGH